MKKVSVALFAGLAACGLALSATPAGAATTKSASPARAVLPTRSLSLPKGYTEVTSGLITAPNGRQTHGAVTCPGTKEPTGGGAVIGSTALSANINSSFPAGQSWAVDVNNTSGADTNFIVYAICMAHSAGYSVVASSATASADSTTSAATNCPARTVVVGGGAESATFDTTVNINSTVPNALAHHLSAWRVAMSSSDSVDTGFSVYAICRPKPAGYSMQFGSEVSNAAGAETSATVTCPGASVPIGGGGFSAFQSTDTALDMNSSYPFESSWVIFENNGGSIDRGIAAAVICAGS